MIYISSILRALGCGDHSNWEIYLEITSRIISTRHKFHSYIHSEGCGRSMRIRIKGAGVEEVLYKAEVKVGGRYKEERLVAMGSVWVGWRCGKVGVYILVLGCRDTYS